MVMDLIALLDRINILGKISRISKKSSDGIVTSISDFMSKDIYIVSGDQRTNIFDKIFRYILLVWIEYNYCLKMFLLL